jgi:hypothetical protein
MPETPQEWHNRRVNTVSDLIVSAQPGRNIQARTSRFRSREEYRNKEMKKYSRAPTNFGASKEERVNRFSGGIPDFTGPVITTVSPLGTSLITPRSHPFAGPVMMTRSIQRMNVLSFG